MFNRNGFQEIDVIHKDNVTTDEAVASVKRLLINKHGGDDTTITTQADMLESLGEIMNWLKIYCRRFWRDLTLSWWSWNFYYYDSCC